MDFWGGFLQMDFLVLECWKRPVCLHRVSIQHLRVAPYTSLHLQNSSRFGLPGAKAVLIKPSFASRPIRFPKEAMSSAFGYGPYELGIWMPHCSNDREAGKKRSTSPQQACAKPVNCPTSFYAASPPSFLDSHSFLYPKPAQRP